MKYVASYYFYADRTMGESAPHLAAVVDKVEEWLSSKGKRGADATRLFLPGGREAFIDREDYKSQSGEAVIVSLTEHIEQFGANLKTSIAIGENSSETVVSIRMAVATDSLAPLGFVVRAPRVVQLILESSDAWTFHDIPSRTQPLQIRGAQGGSRLSQLIWDPSRSVPVISIANDVDESLPRGIEDDLARELAGLAIVAEVDPAAASQVTRERGSEWSCFGGAIRLYWPGITAESNPQSNPLWMASQLASRTASDPEASRLIRDQLRRQVFEQSAIAMPQAPLVQEIRTSARAEQLEKLVMEIAEKEGLAQEILADGSKAEDQVNRLQEALNRQANEIDDLKEQIEQLRQSNKQLMQSQVWKAASVDDIAPSIETPPVTVAEAISRAREELEDTLVFGNAVEDSVDGLAADAGPPHKVLEYLRKLAELTEARREGPLGQDAIKWLNGKNVEASGESETVKNSGQERRKRTWDDGNGRPRFFEHHLKPSTATSGDKCVRIYFDFDEPTGRTVVGWVGQHP